MALTFNPDRKLRFTEAYSAALLIGIRQGDVTKLMFGPDDLPVLVTCKISRIAKAPTKFDVDNSVMEDTCKTLEIEPSREAVLAFLAGDPVARPAETQEQLETRVAARCEELTSTCDIDYCCEQLNKEFPSFEFKNVEDSISIEPRAA